MPWNVRKGGGSKPWKIIKKTTGEVVGSSTSKGKALASVAARYAAESPRGHKIPGAKRVKHYG
jgi:hypothetical protein